jgi:hypothetical protein
MRGRRKRTAKGRVTQKFATAGKENPSLLRWGSSGTDAIRTTNARRCVCSPTRPTAFGRTPSA